MAQLLICKVAALNKYPIILVHGFGDWEQQWKAQGFDVRTAAVGPFSSDRDRVCELYTYIKDGTVNYGASHARFHKHNVTGRTFPGIFPQWGAVMNGQVQKVHLVGHSMGGQTARMLAQMLAHGTKGAPIQEDPAPHELFRGGHDGWIHSITTISTPNQGSTLGNAVTVLGGTVVQLVAGLSGLVGAPTDNGGPAFYDAKLDQFSVSRRGKDESLAAYVKHVLSSSVFKGFTKDNYLYSLTVEGPAEENRWMQTLPSVYYYSFSVQNIFEARDLLLRKVALPQLNMSSLIQPFSLIIGSRYTVDTFGLPESWLANDGGVNTASMVSDGKSEVVEFKSVPVPGRWHHVGLLKDVDHLGGIGSNPKQQVFEVYSAHVALLQSLPNQVSSPKKRSLRGKGAVEVGEHIASDEIMIRLERAISTVDTMSSRDDTECVSSRNDLLLGSEANKWRQSTSKSRNEDFRG